jgi:hypothetical protein
MTPTLEDDLVAYLHRQADRVMVHDALDDIEDDTTHVTFIRAHRRRQPMLILIAAAASIAALVGLASAGTTPRQQSPAAAPASTITATPDDTSAATTSTVTSAPSAPPFLVPLPAGATLQGLTPSCTTSDSIEYHCTTDTFPEKVMIDMTGYTTIVVDDTSHVSGGCRSITPDALEWTCYVGQRAVDQQLVGANYLGDWAPKGYIAG